MHRPPFVVTLLTLLACCLAAVPVLGQPTPNAPKQTFYGQFHQTADGAVVFTESQHPNLVYMPFDPTGVSTDDLNIDVQVQGAVKDSFKRNGKDYRILAVDSIKPMTAEYGATTIAKDRHPGLPGADAAEVHTYPDKICFLYQHYAVLEQQTGYAAGHGLRVLGRNASDAPDAVCESLEGRPIFEIPNGGDFSFGGLSGDTLFIRNGQADAVHGLLAVNLVQQKQTLEATVAPGATIHNGTLRYTLVVPQAFCPKGKAAMRDMALDLKTGRVGAVGKVDCRAIDK